MNIHKTNKIGVMLAKSGFIGGNKMINKIKNTPPMDSTGAFTVNTNLLRHNPKSKIIRVSKSVIDACKLIDIESIRENIDASNFNFISLFVLLDNDKSGIIKVERYGSDFSFIMINNLNDYGAKLEYTYNTYSFISKGFYIEKDEIPEEGSVLINYEKSVFVVQLLTYLIFGDITEKYLQAKAKTQIGLTRIFNNSNLNITFCDSLWKQRIRADGFKVSGHFRLQACGEGWMKRKLIWIEEYEKHGYNRMATVEMQ